MTTELGHYEDLSITIDEGIAVLTLNRPETRNVISDEPLVSELADACLALNRATDVRVVVLTGAGTAFSAGGNVRKMANREGMFAGTAAEIATAYRQGIQRLIQAVWGLEVPSIAAVNGPAIGAGFDLALACDLRIGSDSARFGETFVNLGLVPGDGGSWLLPRVVGRQRAAELAFTGRVVDATEALALGILLSIHRPDELLAAARELGRTMAAKPATAMRYTKRLIRLADQTGFGDLLDATADIQALLHGTPEHAHAVQQMLADAKNARSQPGRTST